MAKRKLYQMQCVEYFWEWYQHGAKIVEHQAWFDNSRTITSMRLAMKDQNFFRLVLSDQSEKVVTETHMITVEVY